MSKSCVFRQRPSHSGFTVHSSVLRGGATMGDVCRATRSRATPNMARNGVRIPTCRPKQLFIDLRSVCYIFLNA